MAHVKLYRGCEPKFATVVATGDEADVDLHEVHVAVTDFIAGDNWVLTLRGHTVEVVF